jgi:hypothetical protein
MTRKLYIPAVLGVALAVAVMLAACKATDMAGNSRADDDAAKQARDASQADGARRVSAAELRKMLEDGEAVVYDTRPLTNYEQEHIKGSLSMPSAEVVAHVGELPKDKTLVFYCT